MKTIGLVLSGGGARGAYQVGVLSAIAEIARDQGIFNPIKIYTGVSAGAINTAFLASGSKDFYQTTQDLVETWSELRSHQVFYTDPASLGRLGFRWIEEFTRGGLGNVTGRSLLNTNPLGDLLRNKIDFQQIQKNIQSGKLRAAAVTAMEYQTSMGVTFVQCAEDIKMWSKVRRYSERAKLSPEHIMASSAIPILFPPSQVGKSFYGDGCIRNQSPCGPAIDLGAEKLIVIGVRKAVDIQSLHDHLGNAANLKPPSVTRVINVLLNAVMLDGIELDIERLEHINKISEQLKQYQEKNRSFNKIDFCLISPSQDIADIAQENSQKLPRIIRYSLKAMGSLQDAKEIISYLLFEPDFCKQLIDIGYSDGMSQKDKLKEFLIS